MLEPWPLVEITCFNPRWSNKCLLTAIFHKRTTFSSISHFLITSVLTSQSFHTCQPSGFIIKHLSLITSFRPAHRTIYHSLQALIKLCLSPPNPLFLLAEQEKQFYACFRKEKRSIPCCIHKRRAFVYHALMQKNVLQKCRGF